RSLGLQLRQDWIGSPARSPHPIYISPRLRGQGGTLQTPAPERNPPSPAIRRDNPRSRRPLPPTPRRSLRCHHRQPFLLRPPGRRRRDGRPGAARPGARRLHAVGQAQVREAGLPLPDHARRVPGGGAAAGARGGAPLHLHDARPGRPLGRRPAPQPRLPARLPRLPRGRLHRLPRHPPAPRLPRRLRLLQARRRAQVQPRPLHGLHREARHLHRRQRRVPAPHRGALRAGRGDVPPRGRAQPPAQPLHGQRAQRGRAGHVRRAGPAVRQDGRQAQGHRRARRQLQPLQPHALALRHGRQQVRAPGQHRELQPGRHGVQRGAHRRRPRQGPSAGAARHVRRGDQHGEHHAQLVLRQRPLHAGVQLPVPHGRRGDPALEPPVRAAALQVPAGAHGAHAQGRRRQGVPVRVPAGGRVGQAGRVAVQGPDGHRRRRAQDQHHHAGAAGAPAERAAALLRDAGGQEAAERQGGALHPGLQAGVRALLHPRRRAGGAGQDGEQPAADGVAHGAVADDAAPVRQHVEQLAVVRAGLRRGQGPDQEGRPHLADRLRVRVQVQQRRVEGAPVGEPGQPQGRRRQPLGRRDPPLPRARAQVLRHRSSNSIQRHPGIRIQSHVRTSFGRVIESVASSSELLGVVVALVLLSGSSRVSQARYD
uniref:Uncharacterized protein n=1 Tax=Aegilops tauschii subsp. strangulata TaxID=200361 RepID=A0A452ZZD4_AEGTS